jgi:autotransporter-associated beta strand protein
MVEGGTWNNSEDLSVGTLGGQGSLTISGSGRVIVSGTISTFIGSGGAGSEGVLTINGGTMTTPGPLSIGVGGASGTLTMTGGLLSSSGPAATVGNGEGLGTATMTGGHWDNAGGMSVGGLNGTLTVNGGTLTNGGMLAVGTSGSGTLVIGSGGVVSSGGGYVGLSGIGQATVHGTWNAGSSLNLGGLATSGSLTIGHGGSVTATTTFLGVIATGSGVMAVNGGTLNTSTLGIGISGEGTLHIGPDGLVTSVTSHVGYLTGTGSAFVNGGTWNNSGNFNLGSLGAGAGTVDITKGVVNVSGTVGNGVAAGSTGTILLSGSSGARGTLSASRFAEGEGSGTIIFDGGIAQARRNDSDFFSGFETGDVSIRGGGAFLDSNGYAVGISTVLTGSGALHKIGSGTLTLSAANQYTGGTVVSEGTLVISDLGSSASVLGSGDVDVEVGGTLAGVGTVLGDTRLAGTLAPGNSPGKMEFAGDLLMEGTATVRMELASPSTYDQIIVNGLLTYDGVLQITLLGDFIPLVGETFVLFDAALAAPGSQFDAITFNLANYQGEMNYATGTLTITAIPEPGTCVLAGLGLCALAAFARRRRLNA